MEPESMRAISCTRSSPSTEAGNDVVPVAAHGDLSEVGDHDYLMRLSEVRDLVGERDGDRAAHAGIDLIEHERGNLIVASERHLHRQHDATHLAA